MATTHYIVTGMTCAHCVSAVTEEVAALEGVTDVQVVLAGSMVVQSVEEVPMAAIATAVAEAGDYSVTEA